MAKYRYRVVKLPDSSFADTAELGQVDHTRSFRNENLLDALDDEGWEAFVAVSMDGEVVVILRRTS